MREDVCGVCVCYVSMFCLSLFWLGELCLGSRCSLIGHTHALGSKDPIWPHLSGSAALPLNAAHDSFSL